MSFAVVSFIITVFTPMFPIIVSFPRLFGPEMFSPITIFVATIFSEGMFTTVPYFLNPMPTEPARDPSHFGADPGPSIIARLIPNPVHMVVISIVIKKEVVRNTNCQINSEAFIIDHFWRSLKCDWRRFGHYWRWRSRLITKMNIEVYLSLSPGGKKDQANQTQYKEYFFHHVFP
jgi:hypothetical protein